MVIFFLRYQVWNGRELGRIEKGEGGGKRHLAVGTRLQNLDIKSFADP
jgi:hypothetical protein